MLPRYDLGDVIFSVSERVSKLEAGSKVQTIESLTVRDDLKLTYATPLTIAYIDQTNNVISKNLYELIYASPNQTIITQNIDNTIGIGTVQDIGITSSPQFGGLSINGDIAVTGTVDGVDVSSLSNNFTSHIFNSTTAHFGQNLTINGTPTFVQLTLTQNPVNGTDVATKNYVDTEVTQSYLQRSVLQFYDPTNGLPQNPNIGDRYISLATTSEWIANNIYEWDGTIWLRTIPNDGFIIWIVGGTVYPRRYVLFNINQWVPIDTTIYHQSLIGAGTNTHDQIDEHIANSTTAHFGQDLTSTGNPTFSSVNVVTVPSEQYQLANKGYVDSKIQGLAWQQAVISFYDPTNGTPVSPLEGDRYISSATASGWTNNYIYEYVDNIWDETIPATGDAVWVKGGPIYPASYLVYNGTQWVQFGSTMDHKALLNIGINTHDQIDAHISNSTNAHFGQDLKITGTPQFASLYISHSTDSTNNTTGSLVIIGGVGIGKTLTSQYLHVSGLQHATDSLTGSVVFDGGVGIRDNLHITETLNVHSTQSAIDTSTGALVIDGGVAIRKNLIVGDIINSQYISVISTLDASSTSTGSLILNGGEGIAKSLYVGNKLYVNGNTNLSGDVYLSSTTQSTSTTTGALILSGGMSIANNLNVNGNVQINGTLDLHIGSFDTLVITSTINSTSISTGSLVVDGGVGIYDDVNVGGVINTQTLNVISTQNSSDTLSGALHVNGGESITKNLYVGDSAIITNTMSSTTGIIYGTTDANTTQIGSLHVYGGVSIDKSLSVSGNNYINGTSYVHDTVVQSTTDTTSTSTGSVIISGGVGIGTSLFIGENINVNGSGEMSSLNLVTGVNATDTQTGTLTVLGGAGIGKDMYIGGGVGITKNLYIGGNCNIDGDLSNSGMFDMNSTIDSSSTSTGSLILAGGMGIAKKLYIGDNTYINGQLSTVNEIISSTVDSSSISTGTLIVGGGTGIAKKLYVGDNTYINGQLSTINEVITSTTNSTDALTGSLIVGGGASIAQNLYVKGTSYVVNTTESTAIGTGCAQFSGGISVAKTMYVGGIGISGQILGLGTLRLNSYGIVQVSTGSQLYVVDTRDSTSVTDGSLRINGGVGIAKKLYVGDNTYINGQLSIINESISSTLDSSSTSTGSLILAGGMGIAKKLYVGDNTYINGQLSTINEIITSTIDSLSISTGSLIINGGAGIAKKLYVGDNTYINGQLSVVSEIINSTLDSSSTSTGSLILSGGLGIAGKLYVGDNTYIDGQLSIINEIISSTLDSSSISTGSLILAGGMGIAKKLHTGNDVIVHCISDATKYSTINTTSTGSMSLYSSSGIVTVPTGSKLYIIDTRDSTAIGEGAIRIYGGASVAKNLFVGGQTNITTSTANQLTLGYDVTNNVTFNVSSIGDLTLNTYGNDVYFDDTDVIHILSTINSTNTLTGSLIISGGASIASNLNVGGYINGLINISNSTQSTSTSTGALIVSGGAGIAKNLFVGGRTNITTTDANQLILGYDDTMNVTFNVSSSGDLTLDAYGNDVNFANTDIIHILSTTDSTDTLTGSLIVSGGMGIATKLYVGDNTYIDGQLSTITEIITSTTNSTDTLTGSLIISGGTSIAKNLNVGGDSVFRNVSLVSTVDSSSTSTGSLILSGGIGIAKKLYVGDDTYIFGGVTAYAQTLTNTNNSTSFSTGTLIVGGGVGIANDIYMSGYVFNMSNSFGICEDKIVNIGTSINVTTGSSAQIYTFVLKNPVRLRLTTMGYDLLTSTYTFICETTYIFSIEGTSAISLNGPNGSSENLYWNYINTGWRFSSGVFSFTDGGNGIVYIYFNHNGIKTDTAVIKTVTVNTTTW